MTDAARESRGVDEAAVAALRGARFFADAPEDVLVSLATEADFVDAGAGEALFREGENSSDLYVLRSGAIAILKRRGDGATLRVGEAFAGETVGEMAMLTGDPRTASAVALRDSELVRLSREAVGRLVGRDPQVALAIARLLARRLAKADAAARPAARPKVFAALPHVGLEPARAADFIARLRAALRGFGSVAIVDRRDRERPRGFLQHMEARHDHMLLVGDAADPDWSACCAKQADLTLLVADARAPPAASPGWPAPPPPGALYEPPRELALLGDEALSRSYDPAWAGYGGHDFIHHVADDGDVARVARLITRQATTIVLSGGGARGFAHLGVVDALREAGLALDVFGGASMGAIIAAAYAGGWPREAVHDRLQRSFVTGRPLSDPVFPVVALFRGKKVGWLLEQAFADRRIEDLRHPFFCVSSCLTSAVPVAHRAGLLRHRLQASVAIPGVLPPVVVDGAVHVDGGIMDNLPIDAASALARGPVIGVDVSGDEHFERRGAPAAPPWWHRLLGGRRAGDPTIMETLWRVGTVGSVSTVKRDQDNAALIMRPPVGSIGLLDWRSFDRAIAIGHDYASRLIVERPDLFAGLRRAN